MRGKFGVTRAYDQTYITYLDIHKNRYLSDVEVATINYIIKLPSVRYVAGAQAEWLFPEKIIGSTRWPQLDRVLQHTGLAWKLATQETMVTQETNTKMNRS
jgi:hypothetical protein